MAASSRTLAAISISSFTIWLTALSILSSSWSAFGLNTQSDRIFGVQVVNEFPHDPDAFTEGLLYAGNDTLYESTGIYGQSSVRRVALRTGKVEVIQRMEHSSFGEGLTLLHNRLFQVTYLNSTGFVYDSKTLGEVKVFSNPMTDGWGLTTDGKVIFGSDGTPTLYKIDPLTFKVLERHLVTYKGRKVNMLNELEYVNGEVWANVWMTNCIVRLSSNNGAVLGWIYAPNLRERVVTSGNEVIDVLNGIAWDQETNRIFLTGKLWPKLFEVKVFPMTHFRGHIEKLCRL